MTTTNENQTQATSGNDGWFNHQAAKFEDARFFWMAVYMTSQSCLGSIACGFILQNHASILMLCVCAVITMAANAVLIALGPPKLCLTLVYLSFFINSIFILINI